MWNSECHEMLDPAVDMWVQRPTNVNQLVFGICTQWQLPVRLSQHLDMSALATHPEVLETCRSALRKQMPSSTALDFVSLYDLNPFHLQRIRWELHNDLQSWDIRYNDVPTVSATNFEVGYQYSSTYKRQLKYVKFYDLLVMDVDGGEVELQRARAYLDTGGFLGPEFYWAVHSTPGGYHLLLLSIAVSPSAQPVRQLMREMPGQDLRYSNYTANFGWKVRLSPKTDTEVTPLIQMISHWGSGKPLPRLAYLHHLLVSGFFATLGRVTHGHFQSFLELSAVADTLRHTIRRNYTHLQYLVSRGPMDDPELARLAIVHVCKPQRPLQLHTRWYIARDFAEHVNYICYRFLRMVDVDGEPTVELWDRLSADRHITYEIHKTQNGYHLFNLTQAHLYIDELKLPMLCPEHDLFYRLYASTRGYCVRLTKKATSDILFEPMGRLGGGPVDPDLEADLHAFMAAAELIHT